MKKRAYCIDWFMLECIGIQLGIESLLEGLSPVTKVHLISRDFHTSTNSARFQNHYAHFLVIKSSCNKSLNQMFLSSAMVVGIYNKLWLLSVVTGANHFSLIAYNSFLI